MRSSRSFVAVWLLPVCLITNYASGTTDDKLATATDCHYATVSGLSGGAFFSTQFHVAYSKTVVGAGVGAALCRRG